MKSMNRIKALFVLGMVSFGLLETGLQATTVLAAEEQASTTEAVRSNDNSLSQQEIDSEINEVVNPKYQDKVRINPGGAPVYKKKNGKFVSIGRRLAAYTEWKAIYYQSIDWWKVSTTEFIPGWSCTQVVGLKVE